MRRQKRNIKGYEIESLGWVPDRNCTTKYISKDGWFILQFRYDEWNRWIISGSGNIDRVYYGPIKSLQELKKIMSLVIVK